MQKSGGKKICIEIKNVKRVNETQLLLQIYTECEHTFKLFECISNNFYFFGDSEEPRTIIGCDTKRRNDNL